MRIKRGSYCCCAARSICTSGGASAGDSTKWRLGSLKLLKQSTICSSSKHLFTTTYNVLFALPCKFSCKVQERLLKIVVALGWYLIVLEILLPMEGNLLCLHLPVLHINLVSTENNGNVFTHAASKTEKHQRFLNIGTGDNLRKIH